MQGMVYEELEGAFEKTYDALRRERARVRTGRANVNLLDGIRVPYYGQPTPLTQVATLQVPEARMITIKPWETSLIKDIERAILQSDLGLTPSNDGNLIRLQIPSLSEERRRNLARKVNKTGEEAKISARNHRRDANSTLKDLQKSSELTEDDLARALKKVQTLTDEAIAKIDKMIEEKEQDLLSLD